MCIRMLRILFFFCGKFKNLVLPLLLARVPCKRAYSTIKLYLRMAGITSLCDVMTKSLAFMCQVQWKTTVNRSRCRMASQRGAICKKTTRYGAETGAALRLLA